ncbi:FtsX-like permease family protein [Chitinophaga agrisoli]|uniref:FtsX-like permease family protein n=1 Tax=Chitinophaga agrisoli TaxID=2607653 RepID=A0A5B2W1V7_9BACT|nr:ABC transporter permease [Chitinophaga agrisoli]KAA2245325.1 FtsX-like permease family protein [Chitinophaga agrisoli]
MLVSYLRIAWRNLRKYTLFSAINILGLAVGLMCALLIIFHVKEELRYDKGYSKADRLFRVTTEGLGDDTRQWAATAPTMGLQMAQTIPEITEVTRFYRYARQVLSYTPSNGEAKRFEEKGGFLVDPSVTRTFDLNFIKGDAATALTATDAIVVTEEMARKYFGQEDPLGKVIVDEAGPLPLKVTGVIRKPAFPTHMEFDYLLSWSTIQHYVDPVSLERRTWNALYTYVLLNKPQSKSVVEAKLPRFIVQYYGGAGETAHEALANRRLHLFPITDIHLHSHMEKELSPNSDITYVYIFSVAALFILLIAAVNFINISTAQAFNRMKEIGLRKVIGASRPQLLRQFLGESFVITLAAATLALVLFAAVLPFYNNLSSKQLHFEQLVSVPNLGILLLLVAVIGLLASAYPAWFVTGFKPVPALKGKRNVSSPVYTVRKGLIIFQFAISVFMIFSALVMYQQMRLFHNKNLGFDKEQQIAVTMYGNSWEHFGTLIHDMDQNTAISNYATVSTLPGERFPMQPFYPLSSPPGEETPSIRAMWSDEKLLATLQIPLLAGRDFRSQFPEIKHHEFILNEAAVKAFGFRDPIGKTYVLDKDTGTVVGLIKDFNFASLHAAIEPLVIQYKPFYCNYLLVKAKAGHSQQTLQFLESRMKAQSPTAVFSYAFMDDKLNLLYAPENRMMQLFKAFSFFAIFVSCLGLFGLSAYAAQLRVKEVGIRKVLGASTYNVTVLLSGNFMLLVLIATLLSWPLAWWTMSRWLNGFAYRIHIDIWIFALSGILAILVAMLTVGVQAMKAAFMNPVKSLKME